MSSYSQFNTTSDAAESSPVLQLISDSLQDPMNLLLNTTMWTGMLIPITVALFVTHSHIWKTPIFIMNACALALGFAFGGVTIYHVKALVMLRPPSTSPILASTCLYFFIPICVQSILLFRVAAVYPPRTLDWVRRILIYGIFAAVLLARLANAITEFVKLARVVHSPSDSLAVTAYSWHLPDTKVEWFLQLFYDVYASSLFLLRLRDSVALRSRAGDLKSVGTGEHRSTYSARLRALFWIATFNFVFPVILNIIILVLAFRESNLLLGVDVLIANVYVEIICVLLATLWCTGTTWGRESRADRDQGDKTAGTGNNMVQSVSDVAFSPSGVVVSRIHFDPEMSYVSK